MSDLELRTIIDEDIYYFLEHHGIKGQQWGVRKAARQHNRALNKASRQADKEAAVKSINKARASLESGKTKREFKSAKAEAHAKRTEIGSREARKIVANARMKKANQIATAHQYKNGKERALGVLAAAGTIAAITIIKSSLK